MNPAPPSEDDRGNQQKPDLSVDELLSTLQHRYRRAIIEYCRGSNHRTAELDELVEYIASEREPASDRDHIAVSLHHVHLPRLAETGVIEWDPRTGHLGYTENEHLERWMDRFRQSTSE